MVIGNDFSIGWRGESLYYKRVSEKAPQKEGGGFRNSYIVIGFFNFLGYDQVPKKLQKNCRAFLKGTSKETGITGLSKIVFAKK